MERSEFMESRVAELGPRGRAEKVLLSLSLQDVEGRGTGRCRRQMQTFQCGITFVQLSPPFGFFVIRNK